MKKRFIIILLIIFTSFFSACDFRFNSTIETSTLNHISTVIMNANIKINTSTYQIQFLQKIEGPYKGFGSGVIIKKEKEDKNEFFDYYVLTNAHVINLDNDYLHEYKIEDINNDERKAELVTKSDVYDLAILKFKSYKDLTVIDLATDNPKINDIVFSVGSPSGKQNIITAGKILAFSEIKDVSYEVIVHDALIYKGSSGSMLINEDFKLVGINTWGFVSEDQTIEEEFVRGGASPIEKILEFLESVEFNK